MTGGDRARGGGEVLDGMQKVLVSSRSLHQLLHNNTFSCQGVPHAIWIRSPIDEGGFRFTKTALSLITRLIEIDPLVSVL